MSRPFIFKATYINEELPPPYKHTYTLVAIPSVSGLEVSYDLKYLERDELEEEEIYSEGFTLADDFAWKGKLQLVWLEYIESFIRKSTFASVKPTSTLTIELADSTPAKVPENIKDWEYMLQELTQAIFEEAGREAPLEITFTEISDGKKHTIAFVMSFAERTLTLFENLGNKVKEKRIDWKESKNLMSTVYSIEYLGEKALLKPPKKNGKFINIGEGAWYQWGTAAFNPDKKQDLLTKLEHIFKSNA